MYDKENSRLILTSSEAIYNFLSNDIEEYMRKFWWYVRNTGYKSQ